MIDPHSAKLGMERCTACGHRWIDYEGVRGKCFLCSSTEITECISLREIREAIQGLRKEDKKYLDTQAKRTVILKQRYREIAELYLQRAQEIYGKISEHFSKGNLTDKVLDQLMMAFRLFSELGIHKSATATAYMAAMGYAQRGAEREVRTLDDLNDLVTARQWFVRLGSREWEAAVNLRIGEKAMAAITPDQCILQTMMQVSLWHFTKAREYYFDQRTPRLVERIQFDIERTTQMLASYARGSAQIEAARITAHSTVQHGEQIRRGLESFGNSVEQGLSTLGEHVERGSSTFGRALQASALALSTNITNALYTVAGSSRLRGRSLDRRMADVGHMISTSAREVPEGFFEPVKELGARFALGAGGSSGGGSSQNNLTSEPSVIKLSESVPKELQKSAESFRLLEEPSIKLTGTLLDTLISKGLGKVLEQMEAPGTVPPPPPSLPHRSRKKTERS